MKRLLVVIALLAVGTLLRAQEPAKAPESAKAGTEAKADTKEEAKGELEVPDSLKWANFALLFIGLSYMLIKLLPPTFANRTADIQKEITEAQAVKRDAEKRAAAVDARMNSLGAEIERVRTELAREMAAEGDRIKAETTALLQKAEAQATAEIESAGKLARNELRQYSSELALKLAEERVRTKLDSSSEAALVDGFVAELGRQGSKN